MSEGNALSSQQYARRASNLGHDTGIEPASLVFTLLTSPATTPRLCGGVSCFYQDCEDPPKEHGQAQARSRQSGVDFGVARGEDHKETHEAKGI
jgi:hypothetical protein